MAQIESEELACTKRINDPDWAKDIGQLVKRAAPHEVFESSVDAITGLAVVKSTIISVKLDTIRPDVDRFGEICSWTYQED